MEDGRWKVEDERVGDKIEGSEVQKKNGVNCDWGKQIITM